MLTIATTPAALCFFFFRFFSLSIKPFETDLYTYISISKLHSVNGSTVFNMNHWCFRSHCISIHIESISSSCIQYGDWRMWICGLRSQCLVFSFYLADFGSMARCFALASYMMFFFAVDFGYLYPSNCWASASAWYHHELTYQTRMPLTMKPLIHSIESNRTFFF